MKKRDILKRFSVWRIKNISDQQFMLFLSIIVGLASGVSAAIIKNAVHLIQSALESINIQYHTYFFLLYPSIGVFLVILFIKYIVKLPIRHGIPNVLYSISQNKGYMKPHNMYSSIISSALTVGFGGSVGLEGPAVSTGAAIGSSIGKSLNLSHKQITLLLGCASAGAMSAIFKAPIAAIVFSMEILMLDLTFVSLGPILLASASAVIMSYLIMGQEVMIPIKVTQGFIMHEVPYYIILGIITGLVSLYWKSTFLYISDLFAKINNKYKKLLIGGFSLGIIILIFPPLYGEGYSSINVGLSGSYDYLFDNSFFEIFRGNELAIILLLVAMILLKVVAASITFGSGGVGGIFAPTLFTGINVGILFVYVLNILGYTNLEGEKFALIGMGGMISGILHGPLTAIFLVSDITGGYQLVLPLLISAAVSYSTVRIFTTNSVYTHQLAERKQLITHDKDKAALLLLDINELMETNFSVVNSKGVLRDLIGVIKKSSRSIFPVVDDDNHFLGVITINDIREIMFRTELYDKVKITELMFMPHNNVEINERMEDIVKKFRTSNDYTLAVTENGKYRGFVSRANIFSAYRKVIQEYSDD